MPESAIGTDIDQPLDVHHYFAAENTFDPVIIELGPELGNIFFGQGMHAHRGIHTCLFYYLLGRSPSYTVYIC
jgi:hypothetical protein